MIFTLEALRARHGDALLLHYGDPGAPKLMLIDGGPGHVFEDTLAPRLEQLREARGLDELTPLPLRLLMVSHIDDDHINGILDLTKLLKKKRSDAEPEPYRIDEVWHNSFDDIVGENAERLSTSAAGGAVRVSSHGRAVLSSFLQGRTLRGDCAGLALHVNEGSGGVIAFTGEAGDRHGRDNLVLHVLGPRQERVDALQEKWDKELEARGLDQPPSAEVTEFVDKSVFNLASIVVAVEAQAADGSARRMLLTGDARGDDVVGALEDAGLVAEGESVHFDVLKLPHHGSDRNVATSFFRRIKADHYVVSGDGRHGNPEVATFQMLFAARPRDSYSLHLTYPPEELIDDYPQEELRALLDRHESHVKVHTIADGQLGLKVDLMDALTD